MIERTIEYLALLIHRHERVGHFVLYVAVGLAFGALGPLGGSLATWAAITVHGRMEWRRGLRLGFVRSRGMPSAGIEFAIMVLDHDGWGDGRGEDRDDASRHDGGMR